MPDPYPARTSEAIIAAARRAFLVGYRSGAEDYTDDRIDDEACEERANAAFVVWWNSAAGFPEVS